MIETVRTWLALLVAVLYPPAFLYWFVIHPFIDTWRRLGKVVTFTFVWTVFLAMACALLVSRDSLLAIQFPFEWTLAGVGIVLYVLAGVIELQTRRHLKFRILIGVPEIDPEGGETKLLTEGIYARVRNPRYVAIMLGLFAFALFTNFLVVWIYAVASVPLFVLLVFFEERELRERFGASYVEYCERVPRFLPW